MGYLIFVIFLGDEFSWDHSYEFGIQRCPSFTSLPENLPGLNGGT